MTTTYARKTVIEDSYFNDTMITVNAAGLFFTGIVMDINPDYSFVLMTKVMDQPEEFNTFYADEVILPKDLPHQMI
jgi:hypothetical protein